MKNILVTFILLGLFSISISSCDEYLDVNNNIDAPDYVEGHLYLAGIIASYQDMYYDLRAMAPLTQMMGTTSGSFDNFAYHSYVSGSDVGGQIWRLVYWEQGMNLENMINQSVEAEQWTLAGIGYAIKAYSWDLLTKQHADLPLKDAFVPGLLSHEYNYQEEIYPQVREWAYKAIEYLEMEDPHEYGDKISSNDYIYYGDKEKWVKFAYAVIVRNLASLSNKNNFTSEYAQELIECANKSFQSSADDATVKVAGGSSSASQSSYNNFWGTYRRNLSYTYFQHDYAVQVFTGTVPKYDEATGEKNVVEDNDYYPYELADKQIICDTFKLAGHYDPRVAVKLATTDDPSYEYMENIDSIKARKYYGGSFAGTAGSVGTAPSFYGRNKSSSYTGDINDGTGRWIYRDDAPYILTTCAEIKFCLAEAYWKLDQKDNALEAFKAGVSADMAFTEKYIYPGDKGSSIGGDKITKDVFGTLANEYLEGPYVNNLAMSDFSLSHIMMQKWVSLYPWGAFEAWVDMRKYHYDLSYSGDYPHSGNGWDISMVDQKWDTDETKVFKGLYLPPAQVSSRKITFDTDNEGAPCYRIRPRYNSEYMWNVPSLESLLPISGTADDYQCSIPWFAYPGDLPTNVQ